MIIDTNDIKLTVIMKHGKLKPNIGEIGNQILQTKPIAVYCKDCDLHGNCMMECLFNSLRIENPFCCAGKSNKARYNYECK